MSEASPVVPTSTAVVATPKPAEKVAAPAPTQQQPEAPKPAESSPELARIEAARKKMEERERRHTIDVRRFSAEKKRLEALEKAEKERGNYARLNPVNAAREIWGEQWYEYLTEARINGGVPADVVAAEFGRMESKLEKRFAEQEDQRKQALAKEQEQVLANARRDIRNQGTAFFKANEAEYGLLKRFGDTSDIGALLAQRIEHEYNKSTQRDADGNILEDGRVLSPQEAADLIVGEMVDMALAAAGEEKYRARFLEKLQPAKQNGTVSDVAAKAADLRPRVVPNPQRKTLSNDLTGSSSTVRPPSTEAERRARAIAARDAFLAGKPAR